MDFFVSSLVSAVSLVFDLDPELLTIVQVSLKVSCLATLFATLLAVPLAFFIALNDFFGKRIVIVTLNTLLALPTVVIGLFVYSFFSRRGLLGSFDLLYSQWAMVAGQILLIIPLITALTIAAISRIDKRYGKTALTLGANTLQTALVIFKESRFAIVSAVIAAFGRVISEVGISMMLGGNIKGFTRTMTTAMALEYDKGSFDLAVALGMVLMCISLGMNVLFHFFQGRAGNR